jgi:hypothetical protein
MLREIQHAMVVVVVVVVLLRLQWMLLMHVECSAVCIQILTQTVGSCSVQHSTAQRSAPLQSAHQ